MLRRLPQWWAAGCRAGGGTTLVAGLLVRRLLVKSLRRLDLGAAASFLLCRVRTLRGSVPTGIFSVVVSSGSAGGHHTSPWGVPEGCATSGWAASSARLSVGRPIGITGCVAWVCVCSTCSVASTRASCDGGGVLWRLAALGGSTSDGTNTKSILRGAPGWVGVCCAVRCGVCARGDESLVG